MLFQWTKKLTIETQDFVLEDLIASSESFPAELSLITEEKRLIKVAVLHLQRNDMEDEGNFFFPLWEGRDLKIVVWVEVCFSAKTNYLKQIYKCDQVSIFTIIGVQPFPPERYLKGLEGRHQFSNVKYPLICRCY